VQKHNGSRGKNERKRDYSKKGINMKEKNGKE